MAETVTVTKSANDDFQVVVTDFQGSNYTKQFPRADYDTNAVGVKLNPYLGRPLMYKFYEPAKWTVGVATGFATNKEVTDALTALANS